MSEPNFTADWFTGNIRIWERILAPYKEKPNLHFLEIGCFEGRATIWLLENILTGEYCDIIVIDTFKASDEHGKDMSVGLETRFRKNIEAYNNRIIVKKGMSQDWLRIMEGNAFDVIYIDGSHYAADVLSDAVLSFPLLKSGGIMIFDDYQWRPYSEEWKMPRAAINGFCASYENKTEIIHVGYQLILKKL